MAFNFSILLGLEQLLNDKREIIILWSFIGVLVLAMIVSFVAYVFRKLNINRYLIDAVLWALVFTLIVGVITIMILFFITDISGVKLAYIWLSIFIGYLCFSLLYNNALKKLFNEYSKTIKD